MIRWLFLALAALPLAAGAVVIRHDVDDARYRIEGSEFPALADMPGEGQGVLIAPQWVLTAAHAAPMEGMGQTIAINGKDYGVERVIVHPGYRRMPEVLGKEALATGSPAKIHAFLAGSDDIALIRLTAPVTDVQPVSLYRGSAEVTQVAALIGKGATGNGALDCCRAGRIAHRCGAHATPLPVAMIATSGIGSMPRHRASPWKAYWATATVAARWLSGNTARGSWWGWARGSAPFPSMPLKPASMARWCTTCGYRAMWAGSRASWVRPTTAP